MTPIHLDTSFLVRSLHRESEEARRLERWLSSGQPVAISAIAWAEFQCGPLDQASRSAATLVVGTPLALQSTHADLAAALFNATGRRRGSLADCLVAAVAIGAQAQLATADASFDRFVDSGLVLA